MVPSGSAGRCGQDGGKMYDYLAESVQQLSSKMRNVLTNFLCKKKKQQLPLNAASNPRPDLYAGCGDRPPLTRGKVSLWMTAVHNNPGLYNSLPGQVKLLLSIA